MRVLERPETPPHTNAWERDLRGFVIKRKISGCTVNRKGRQARDSMLGLSKACQKLGLSFWYYLGDRLGVGASHPSIPLLATMIIGLGKATTLLLSDGIWPAVSST
nr:hypothetical protein [uncultured Rhizobium sp.]